MLSPIFGMATNPSTTATQYISLTYPEAVARWNSTESNRYHPMPGAFTISSLNITVTTAPGSGKSYAFTVMKNGVATSLSATISNTSTTASDSSNTATFAAGDLVSLRCVPTGTPTATGIMRWNMTASGTGQPITGEPNSTGTTSSFHSLGFGAVGSETLVDMIASAAGTISNLYVVCTVAPGGVTTRPVTLRVNNVSSALTATVTSAATTASDTTHSVSVAAGDRLNIFYDVTGIPASAMITAGILFTPTVDGDAIYALNAAGATPSTTAVGYALISPSATSVYTATESNVQLMPGAWRLKKYYFRTLTATGAAKSYTGTVRKNTADTTLTVTATNTTVSQSVTSDVDIAATDLVNISVTPAGTPTTGNLIGGLLINAIPAPAGGNTTNFFAMF